MERFGLAVLRKPSRLSLLSLTLALQSLLTFFEILNVFHVTYFPMIHRVTFAKSFSLGFSLAPALLLLSSFTIVYLLMEKKRWEILVLSSMSVGLYLVSGIGVSVAVLSFMLVAVALLRFRRFQDFAFWILILLTGFEGVALIHWILLPLGVASPMTWFADLELSLFYVVAPMAPLLAAAILCMWFLRPLIRYVGVDRFFVSRLNLESGVGEEEIDIHPSILLALALFFSVVGALYPYSPKINPNSVPVGVDTYWYIEWMAKVERDLISVFTTANGSRPAMLLLIHFLGQVSGWEVLEIVKYLPVLLNPLLAFVVYFLVSRASGDVEWAALSSLFTALGFSTTVGMYSYFLTNIFALVLNFSAISFLFKSIKTESKIYLILALALGSFVVFTHPWTFVQYYAAIALFLGYRHFKVRCSDGGFIVLIYLVVTGVINFLKGIVMGSLEGVGSISSAAPQLIHVAEFWSNNVFIFRLKYGGLLSNIVLLGLAALGVYIMKVKDDFKLFLVSLLVTSSSFYFVTNEEAISRLLYNIPLEIFAVWGQLFLIRSGSLKKELRMALMFFAGVSIIVYLLRSLANLV